MSFWIPFCFFASMMRMGMLRREESFDMFTWIPFCWARSSMFRASMSGAWSSMSCMVMKRFRSRFCVSRICMMTFGFSSVMNCAVMLSSAVYAVRLYEPGRSMMLMCWFW